MIILVHCLLFRFSRNENRMENKRQVFYDQGPVVQKLTTSLVNVSLKFQTLISQISRYFLLKKYVKLLHCKSFSHFFNKKFQCIWL